MPDTAGLASGTFAIPTVGESSANVWYRVHLTATDSAGFTATSSVDVLPNTASITLATVPSGLTALLDGQPVVTPVTITSVVGVIRTLGVVAPQMRSGLPYYFSAWSDGGQASHTIATPTQATTFVVTYATPPSAPQNLRVVQ
jgi:hypothetical protein